MFKCNLYVIILFVYQDVKCSGNWMWFVKLLGEGVILYDVCVVMCDVMVLLGIVVDGGKDFLSMVVWVGQDIVKFFGVLVILVYVVCFDICVIVILDLKMFDGKGNLLWVKFGDGFKYRLGGSVLVQVYNQLGSQVFDLDDVKVRLFIKVYIDKFIVMVFRKKLW